jgi:flavin-dependent dehydrogenase
MTTEHFQNLVIGSGVAGKTIAWTLASQGQKTVVVERAVVGGSCPSGSTACCECYAGATAVGRVAYYPARPGRR